MTKTRHYWAGALGLLLIWQTSGAMAQQDVPVLDANPLDDPPAAVEKGDAPDAPLPVAPEAPVDPELAAEPPPAAVEPPMAPAAPVTQEIIGVGVTPQASTNRTMVIDDDDEELISITLDDVPLLDVVRMFTRISGANIIASPDQLTGSVTVNLTEVKWKPALESILAMHDLGLDEKVLGTQVYTIVPVSPDAPPPLFSRSFQLKFSAVPEVTPVIRPMLADGATLAEFPSRNMIVIRSTAKNLDDIGVLIEEIDLPTKQVCIEAKFLELTDQAAEQLGIRWDSLAEFGVKLDTAPLIWSRSVDSTDARRTSQTKSDNRSSGDRTAEYFDINGVQYQDATVTDVERPPGSGIYVSETTLDPTRTIEDSVALSQNYTEELVSTFNKSISESQAAIMEFDSFQVVLSALRQTDGVSIVSNPKMIVANGSQDAYIRFGEREPIIITEVKRGTIESPGDQVTAKLDTEIDSDFIQDGYLRTGIDLKVVPVVKTDDLIEADLEPRFSRKLGDKTVGENSWPIISVKEIKTRFTLRSGQTVAIGGLTDKADSTRISKVPLLGDIPILGKYLFSHKEDIESQVETIIFVTLSLAIPEELEDSVGIPRDSALVYKEIIRDQAEAFKFETDMEALRQATDKEIAKERKRRHKLLNQN